MTEKVSVHSLPSAELISRGLVQIFTGDGKGKTSAALGKVLRALGHGLRVYITYFMKGGDYPYGERRILSQLPNVTMASFGSEGFIDPARIKPEDIEQAKQALSAAREAMLSGNYALVVLDEVIRLIKDKPQNVELILTGRQADAKLVGVVDMVTEMLKIKHPYDEGVTALKGIDY